MFEKLDSIVKLKLFHFPGALPGAQKQSPFQQNNSILQLYSRSLINFERNDAMQWIQVVQK